MRLKDVIIELNISSDRAIKFLKFNGFQQYYTISTKLNKDEIEKLIERFQSNNSNIRKPLKEKFEKKTKKKRLDYELIEYKELESETTGLDFNNLFGEYFILSKHIVIYDPYIRHEHQIRNLIELTHTILKLSKKLTSIRVITGYEDENQKNANADTFEAFSRIAKKKFKFDFEYSFDLNFHDRKIEIDKSILILLGRGLDIYNSVNQNSHHAYNKLKLKNSFLIILKRKTTYNN